MVNVRWGIIALLLVQVVASAGPVSAQVVTAYVDRNPIQLEETVQFVVRFNGGNPGGTPDLSALEQDFDVLGTAQSTQTSIMNGQSNTVTQWVSTLAPKRAGAITIPPIRVGSDVSAPVTLTVLQSGQRGQGGRARDMFIDIQVEPQDPYVQSQVTYTVKLYHAVPIREGRLDEPNSANVQVQKLGEDRSYETVLDGRRYQVIERQYAVFPQKSGSVTLPALTFTGQVPEQRKRRSLFDDMMGSRPRMFGNDPFDALFQTTRAVRTRSEPVTLKVRPMPGSFTGDHWLPSEGVILQETWTPENLDQQVLRVGEPITRTITLLAKGTTGAQLPDFPATESDNTKIYPDQAVTETKVDGASTIGVRQQKLAFVPTEPGSVRLPAIDIPWWDLTADQPRVARLPSRMLKILPAPGEAQPANPPGAGMSSARNDLVTAEGQGGANTTISSTDEVNHTVVGPASTWWQMGTAALALLWVVTGLGWWYDRRKRWKPVDSKSSEAKLHQAGSLKQAKAAFETACRANKPKHAKDSLLRWAAKKWPVNPPLGLTDVAERLADPRGQAAIWDLDRYLYAPTEGAWDGQDFCRIMCSAMEVETNTQSLQGETLPPLYLTGT